MLPLKYYAIQYKYHTKSDDAQRVSANSSGARSDFAQVVWADHFLSVAHHVLGEPVGPAVQLQYQRECRVCHLLDSHARDVAYRYAYFNYSYVRNTC